MAIQRIDGYVYSCAPCGAVYPRRRHRGESLQDEIDHHRAVPDGTCRCRLIDGHRHHAIACLSSHQRAAAPPSPTGSTAATL